MERKTDDNFIMLPTVDFCFKELMQNPKVRQGFISALLSIEPKAVEKTELMPTILQRESADDKLGILDVRVKLADGKQMDFEMQVASFDFWEKRILFYLSKMYTGQLKKGESYEKLLKCIHVSILDFIHFPEDTRCYRTISFCDTETGCLYSDLMEIKILELKKLQKNIANDTNMNDTVHSSVFDWMKFFTMKVQEAEPWANADWLLSCMHAALSEMEPRANIELSRVA